MSEVTLSIAGRTYAVSCADGEEAHVAGLGAVLHQALVSYCVTRPAALTMDRSTYLDPTCPGLKFTQ